MQRHKRQSARNVRRLQIARQSAKIAHRSNSRNTLSSTCLSGFDAQRTTGLTLTDTDSNGIRINPSQSIESCEAVVTRVSLASRRFSLLPNPTRLLQFLDVLQSERHFARRIPHVHIDFAELLRCRLRIFH